MTGTIIRSVAIAGLALFATACSGGDDDKNDDPVCPTGTNATTLELTGVAPAAGTSVTNSMITHTFQTVGADARLDQLLLVTLPNHTAGSIPQFTGSVLPVPRTDGSGNDYQYSFTITWPTAPGHVAIADPGQYQNPKDNCVFQLPTPLFEYDITAP